MVIVNNLLGSYQEFNLCLKLTPAIYVIIVDGEYPHSKQKPINRTIWLLSAGHKSGSLYKVRNLSKDSNAVLYVLLVLYDKLDSKSLVVLRCRFSTDGLESRAGWYLPLGPTV